MNKVRTPGYDSTIALLYRFIEAVGCLIIIEDCCHTFNSEYDGNKVGSFSDACFYSFEWGKPISLGLGGAVQVKNQQKEQQQKFH